MNYKIPALCLLGLSFLYQIFTSALSRKSIRNPVPENVADIYDEATYKNWRNYTAEKERLNVYGTIAAFALQFLLILFDAYSAVVHGITNVYSQVMLVILLFVASDALIGLPFSYIDTMLIEQKYGFNHTTRKTFVSDTVKQFIIGYLLSCSLICLLALIHRSLGDWILILFTAVLAVFVLLMTFLNPIFTKIFNKFTPLPEGSLRGKLTALLEKYGYRVKSIDVMDASRRSTKSNAYFTGFGRMKTIVLFDTLLDAMDEDEVCAIFAHEMGHGLHRDTLKMQLMNLLNIVMIVVLLWLTVRTPAIYGSFGFGTVNYAFAFILLALSELPVFQPLLGLITNAYSRHAEYCADRQAVRDGYGEPLARSLKKLCKENFADLSPSPLLVKLTYSHPPISQRLRAIEEAIAALPQRAAK